MEKEDKPEVEVGTIGHVDHRPLGIPVQRNPDGSVVSENRVIRRSNIGLTIAALAASLPNISGNSSDYCSSIKEDDKKYLGTTTTPTKESVERINKAKDKRARKAEKLRIQLEKQNAKTRK